MKFSEKKRAQCASGIVTTGCGSLSGLIDGGRRFIGHGPKMKRCKKGTRRVGGKCRRKK